MRVWAGAIPPNGERGPSEQSGARGGPVPVFDCERSALSGLALSAGADEVVFFEVVWFFAAVLLGQFETVFLEQRDD